MEPWNLTSTHFHMTIASYHFAAFLCFRSIRNWLGNEIMNWRETIPEYVLIELKINPKAFKVNGPLEGFKADSTGKTTPPKEHGK